MRPRAAPDGTMGLPGERVVTVPERRSTSVWMDLGRPQVSTGLPGARPKHLEGLTVGLQTVALAAATTSTSTGIIGLLIPDLLASAAGVDPDAVVTTVDSAGVRRVPRVLASRLAGAERDRCGGMAGDRDRECRLLGTLRVRAGDRTGLGSRSHLDLDPRGDAGRLRRRLGVSPGPHAMVRTASRLSRAVAKRGQLGAGGGGGDGLLRPANPRGLRLEDPT